MRRVLIFLTACGGDPFTLADPVATPLSRVEPEAGSLVVADSSAVESNSAVDAGAQDASGETRAWDALTTQDSPQDAASELWGALDASNATLDAPQDAQSEPYSLPDACTPFSPPITWTQSCDGVMATVPSAFMMIVSQPCGGEPTGGQLATATPKPCQCQELYTCACLDRYGVCGQAHPTACQPSPNANSPIVVKCY